MKIEITEKGVYDGKGQRIPVGTVINVKDGEIPSNLVGKGRAVRAIEADQDDAQDAKTAVTNPAKKG
jgi:hypothetical protein